MQSILKYLICSLIVIFLSGCMWLAPDDDYPARTYNYGMVGDNKSTIIPEKGFVPDEQTAIRIAVAVWTPIFGEKKIRREKPYHAKNRNGVWVVTGSLPPYYMFGGVATAEISQKDGQIIRVIHTK